MRNLFTALSLILLIASPLATQAAAPAAKSEAPKLGGNLQKLDEVVNSPVLNVTADDIILGDAKAPVTIVEYASLSCPHCAAFTNKILPDIKTQFIDTGKVRYVYRHFPLNPAALRAAQVVQCAPKDKREGYVTVMFRTQNKWAFDNKYLDSLGQIARIGGMSKEQFDTCINSKEAENAILEAQKIAGKELGISSTPSFFVNGRRFVGEQKLEVFAEAINKALDEAAKKEPEKPVEKQAEKPKSAKK